MSEYLEARLRTWTHHPHAPPACELMEEAADELARMRAEADANTEALSAVLEDYRRLDRRWEQAITDIPMADSDELSRLRGELVLWKAAARLTPSESAIMTAAIQKLEGTQLARELGWLHERLTHER